MKCPYNMLYNLRYMRQNRTKSNNNSCRNAPARVDVHSLFGGASFCVACGRRYESVMSVHCWRITRTDVMRVLSFHTAACGCNGSAWRRGWIRRDHRTLYCGDSSPSAAVHDRLQAGRQAGAELHSTRSPPTQNAQQVSHSCPDRWGT